MENQRKAIVASQSIAVTVAVGIVRLGAQADFAKAGRAKFFDLTDWMVNPEFAPQVQANSQGDVATPYEECRIVDHN